MRVTGIALVTALFAASPLRGSEPPAQRVPTIDFHPGAAYGPAERKYQGIPTIERAPNGRLWAAWYAGPVQEDRYNYVVAATSADDGRTWSDLEFVIDPDGFGPVRASDPCLWLDPGGRLWLFWFQNPDKDVADPKLFAVTTENPGDADPRWSAPHYVADGIALNKPVVLANGDWLLPAAIWRREQSCRVLASTDRGATWQLRGTAGIPRVEDRQCDEPMIVERRDGSLWMLVRTNYGIGESVSTDAGRTWTPVAPTTLPHTATRFHLRRLASGRLLLVKHGPLSGQPVGRRQLQAYLSDDDGKSWQGGLTLDERACSYPDSTQAPDGTIRVIYDHDRMDAGQVLLAKFNENDVLRAGARPEPEHEGIQDYATSASSAAKSTARFKVLVNAATGMNTRPWLKDGRFLRPRPNQEGVPVRKTPAAELGISNGQAEIATLMATERFVAPPEGTPTALRIAAPNQRLFRDQPHTINVVPEELAGLRYIVAPSGHAAAVCREPGMVFVLTPAAERSLDSIEEDLRGRGFTKVAAPEFLFVLTDRNRALPANLWTVFQKFVEAGETIEVRGAGVIVF
jgi:predicted neuraminidase